ncbi:hypothetical protein D3P96_02000 [Weissella viridescens]|uniref:TraX protein n=1 Tax=Weissella viridescens TaxID=1629 RepID=A0A3P2RDE6_WEIVI|nr:TraX family protein [Weissella viridescens]RRG18779.1 hypothetical protein D3P96_02000 [Weissella viridescens]
MHTQTPLTPTSRFSLTGTQLKFIAAFFMLIDHIHSYFPEVTPDWFSFLGRFVAPLFTFLLVEGFFYTHSRRKYLTRLTLGASVMVIMNTLQNVLTGAAFDTFTHKFSFFLLFLSGHNIFITLALMFSVIWLIDILRQQEHLLIKLTLLLPIGALMVLTLMVEGGVYLLPIVLVCYFSHNQKKWVMSFILLFSLLLLGKSIFTYYQMQLPNESLYSYLTFSSEFMMILAVPLIGLYNGQRGGNGSKWDKNFFYYFYPAHLAIIYIIYDFIHVF